MRFFFVSIAWRKEYFSCRKVKQRNFFALDAASPGTEGIGRFLTVIRTTLHPDTEKDFIRMDATHCSRKRYSLFYIVIR